MARHRSTGPSPYEARYGFARAIRVGDQVFLAGTAPIGPDGATVAPGDPAAQMRRCLEIARQALEPLGASLQDVVRSRMLIADRADADAIGAVHAEAFAATRPVATMVTTGLLNPDWLVELELDAIIAGDR